MGGHDHCRYAVGKAFADAGVVPCLDMTVEACVTKLAHLLAAYSGNTATIRGMLATPIRGEISRADMYTVQQAAVSN